LNYATVTAPIAGRVGAVNYTVGALVHTSDQTPVLAITEMAPVRVTFAAPESDLDAFRAALAGKTGPTTRALDPISGKAKSQGVASFIDSLVNAASGMVG
jgi:multidrug efflux system membrane fusion protein